MSIDAESGGVSAIPGAADDMPCDGRIDQYGVVSIPDDGVGWMWRCFGDEPTRRYRIVTLSALDEEIEVRSDLGLREVINALAIGPAEHPVIVAAIGSRICNTLVALTADEAVGLAIRIEGPGPSFELNDPTITSDCEEVGLAGYPAISVNGRLAFLASTEAAGLEGPARLRSPDYVYIMDSLEGPAVRHLGPLVNASDLAWSPSGNGLAFSAEVNGLDGTWIYDPSTDGVLQISTVRLASIGWSSNERQIIGQRDVGDMAAGTSELVILERP